MKFLFLNRFLPLILIILAELLQLSISRIWRSFRFLVLCAHNETDMKKWTFLALLPFLMVSCAKPETFEYLGIQSIKVKSMNFSEANLEIVGAFYNPNKFPVQFKDASVDLSINGVFLGQSNLDSTIVVPKKDTFQLPVLLNVKMSMEMINLVARFMGGEKEFEIELKGKSKIGRGGFFINYPIYYKGQEKID
jgi:LEA14-like dessication related protein